MSSVLELCAAAGGGATFLALVGGFFAKRVKHGVGEVAANAVKTAVDDFRREVDQRFNSNDEQTKANGTSLADLQLKLASEFGGNSHGMRQAVNELGKDLATLNGKFDQHIQEGCR